MAQSILVIDDEVTLAKNIQTYLTRHGYEVRTATSGEQGLAELDEFQPDVVLLDFHLGGIDGLEVLRRIRARDARIKVIMLTAHGGVQVAVEAMKTGANDYLGKPLALGELKLLLDKIMGQQRIEGALAYYQGREAEQSGLAKMLGESPAMLAVKRRIRQFIDAEQRLIEGTPPAVLVTGATGTGKELVARAFHFDGQRRGKPFVEINCASIPAQLMETELFGHERGAFTDAKERKLGLVEAADGGTLFLDEIGEMDAVLQAKLLRSLENKSVRRVGGLRDQPVDVRIIAATNRDLDDCVRQGSFRADLLFRLRIIHLELPPLCARDGDVLLLAKEFIRGHGKRYGKADLQLSPAASAALCRHHWPGNVRELGNVIEQAVLLAEGKFIEPVHLALPAMRTADPMPVPTTATEAGLNLEKLELEAISSALNQTAWNVTRAAKLLGLSRDTLRYRMDKYQLQKSWS